MTSDHPFRDDLERVKRHYAALIGEHGDAPAGAQWADRETQERRFEVLCEVGDLTSSRVLDYGCGTAHLLDFLKQRGFVGRYTGYDLVPKALEVAEQRHPTAVFEARDVLEHGVEGTHDYVVVSGVFNSPAKDPLGLMTATLSKLFASTNVALAFNCMSRYVDFLDPELSYFAPEEVFAFCKQTLSPRVCLRHDYEVRPGVVPYEFAVYVYRTDVAPRRLQPAP